MSRRHPDKNEPQHRGLQTQGTARTNKKARQNTPPAPLLPQDSPQAERDTPQPARDTLPKSGQTPRPSLQASLVVNRSFLVNYFFHQTRLRVISLVGDATHDLTQPIQWNKIPLGAYDKVQQEYHALFRQLKNITNSALQTASRGSIIPKTVQHPSAPKIQANLPDISKRIWAFVGQERDTMELLLHKVLQDKRAPHEAVGEFVRFLNLPNEAKRQILQEGNTELTQKALRLLNPGTGVYRDPVKNVLRLLKTEINRATKTADWEYMQQSPYIIGYRIKRSARSQQARGGGASWQAMFPSQIPHKDPKNKPRDLECQLCDRLTGEYPKTFKFVGWHPNCECVVEPIFVRNPAERKRLRKARKHGTPYAPHGTITSLPQSLQERYHRLGIANRHIVDTALKPYNEQGQYAEIYKEFTKYQANDNYKDVAFNPFNGGLKATNKGHHFDKNKGYYETEVQDAGFKAGHSVILEAEDHNTFKKRNTEGLWDNMTFEIAGAETATPKNIRNALKHCAKKKETEVAVVYLPNEYTRENISQGLSLYYGLKHDKKQFKRFKEIYFIPKNKEIIKKILPKL